MFGPCQPKHLAADPLVGDAITNIPKKLILWIIYSTLLCIIIAAYVTSGVFEGGIGTVSQGQLTGPLRANPHSADI